ncbi:MAG: WD40 repeat domain-containing protein [Campylobacterales bacterium]|nr:WD40 repeat domain-containing protein [Campylobacterales bacterium]
MARKLLILIFAINLFAVSNLNPVKIFKATGTVQDILFENGKLYAGTDNGTVEIFDTNTNEKIEVIKLPDIKDFMGDTISAKVYSIDKIDNKILITSQGIKGYRNIFIYENKSLQNIIGIDQKYFFQKASFVNENMILFGLLSNQIGLYDIKNKKLVYLIQISPSSFSHFKLSEDKTKIATTDESGIVRVLDVFNAKVIEQPKALNLDRVYQVDFKKGVILTAGQDRKSVVYKNNSSYSFNFDFLLYSCALSPSAKLGGVAYNEKNEVLVFDINTHEYLYKLKGQKATLTQILFINEKEIFVSSDDSNINYFKLD